MDMDLYNMLERASKEDILEKYKKEYEMTSSESEKLRLKNNITMYEYYIKGLQDAKKYIEEESE